MDDWQTFGRKLLLSVVGNLNGESGAGRAGRAGEKDGVDRPRGLGGLIGPDGLAGPLEFGEPPDDSVPPEDRPETPPNG